MPTVRDQVAFMAYLVLLGPLLDNQFYSFVFGNRLYRPLVWNTRGATPRWEQRAYPLVNRQTFLPYARSHGLFRRVASWTVSRMTKAVLPEEDYAGRVHRPSDYDSASLPRWVQQGWWEDESRESNDRAYWASLDIQLAYPSVRLPDLLAALLDLARTPCVAEQDVAHQRMVQAQHSLFDVLDVTPSTTLLLHDILDGYPHTLLEGLARQNLREDLVRGLVTALEGVTVDDSGVPIDAWRPHHARADLPPKNSGLPTGLAISGLLLNAVLHRVDTVVHEYLAETSGNDRGAIARFADDMCVLCRSAEGLFQLIDVVWGAVEATTGPRPIVAEPRSNLYVNLSKVDPSPVNEVVSKCLQEHFWKPCEDCDELEPSTEAEPASLAEWWQDNGEQFRNDMARSSIGPGEVGPFVTTLVERLSAIGNDTLGDRFGQGARDRQILLHDLARFDIADEQVRADTRRAFAANRLAGAWLSRDPAQAHHELVEIRRSVAKVVKETPWKFSLWGAVVRTAARRAPKLEDHYDKDDNDARQWLLGLLTCVSKVENYSWLEDWPEENVESPHQISSNWRHRYISFHRAAFWQALADVIGRLYAHDERQQEHRRGSGPLPRSWATRAVPEGLHGHVAGALAEIDTWMKHLYGEAPDVEDIPHWELDRLVVACLAALPRSAVAEAWRRCGLPAQDTTQVALPDGLLTSAPATSALLVAGGRIVAATRKRRGALDRSAIAQLLLSSRNDGLDDVLFPKAQRPRLRTIDPTYNLAVARQFNCKGRTSDKVVRKALRQAESRLRYDSLALQEYDHARSVLLGRRGLSWP